MKNDPDEARLPAEVQQWRALAYASREWLYKQLKSMGNYVETGTASNCLRWLATAPLAILLAASAKDAVVLSNVPRNVDDPVAMALYRAHIRCATDYVCLPRAEVEALLGRLDSYVPRDEDVFDEAFDSGYKSAAAHLRALLARETGKGEG